MKKLGMMIIALGILCLICSCGRGHQYDLGIENGTDHVVHDVSTKIFPKGGEIPGGKTLRQQISSWYMMIDHWPVPEKCTVSFTVNDQPYVLSKELSLPKRFRGKILLIIKSKDSGYYLDAEITPEKLIQIEIPQIL